MTNYDYIRPELVAMMPVYRLTKDCYVGERAVKQLKGNISQLRGNGAGATFEYGYSQYLPDPSPYSEKEEVKNRRYKQYVQRAVFYNVTRRTVDAMAGAVFAKYPLLELDGLEYLEKNICGGGMSLTQQAKGCMIELMLKGRVGLLADVPVNKEGVSKADMQRVGIRPVIKRYDAESIINWRTTVVGAHKKLSLVVLSETYVKDDDGYKQEVGEQLLILRLNEAGYAESEVVRKTDNGWASEGVNTITDNTGRPLEDLPFYFAGSENNDEEIDEVPIYDIAQLNIAHFRDSADYQEQNFICGQPTLVVSGLTQEWVDDNLTEGITIGARSGVLLPQGGSAQLLQAQSSSVNMEAMLHKEKQMQALGARLIEVGSGFNTATEAASASAEETSILTSLAYNLSDAYTKAVRACARFAGIDEGSVTVTFNTQFTFAKMTPQQRQQLVSEWQAGLISFSEAREALVEDEIATIEDAEEAQRIIDQEQGEMLTQDRVEP